MTNIRKTSNVVSIGKGRPASGVTKEESSQVSSPFAVNPAQTLKSLTERRSRELSEEQRLSLLQRALHDFSEEASRHLPDAIGKIKRRVRNKMLAEGFADVIANEAGEEAVDVLLESRRVHSTSKKG